jgi:hypothetical protein
MTTASLAKVRTRTGIVMPLHTLPFTAAINPHSFLKDRYGVAMFNGRAIAVSRNNKDREWRELATTSNGKSVFYVGTTRYGSSQTLLMFPAEMHNYYNRLLAVQNNVANNKAVSKTSALNSDCVLIDAKTKSTQFISKNTSITELESIIARRSMDKATVQILCLATKSIRNVYVTEVVTTTRLAI